MLCKDDPPFVLDARRARIRAKDRVVRQQRRVASMNASAPNRKRAEALLTQLQRREQRYSQYVSMVTGWWRKHKRRKFPPALRAKFVGPRKKRETVEERKARWDQHVRAFLDERYGSAPHYKSCVLMAWEK